MLPWNSSLYNATGVMQRVERLPLLQLRLVPCTVEPTFVNSGGFPGIGQQLRVGMGVDYSPVSATMGDGRGSTNIADSLSQYDHGCQTSPRFDSQFRVMRCFALSRQVVTK